VDENRGQACYSTDSTATEAAHDRRTDEVIAAIQKTGEAFFGGTT